MNTRATRHWFAEHGRRDFLASLFRGTALAGLLAFAWREGAKRERLASDPDCVKIDPCSSCGEFGSCELPRARENRTRA